MSDVVEEGKKPHINRRRAKQKCNRTKKMRDNYFVYEFFF